MTDNTIHRKPPLPVAQSFITCHEVFRGTRTGASLLVAPSAHIPVDRFPAQIHMAVFAEFTGGHGSYHPALSLRDGSDEAVWGWPPAPPADPFHHTNPLLPSEVTLVNLLATVPRAGRYTLVLLLNDEEAARRALWIGPTEAFKSPVSL